jgi:hypothetical protein
MQPKVEARAPAEPRIEPRSGAQMYQGFLYGRISTLDGAAYEGRLRWGVHQEAFWSDYFNGTRRENPWLAHVRPEQLPAERRPPEIFGFRIRKQSGSRAGRQLMTRFGDITLIEAHGAREVRVTLKNGTVVDLDRLDASDFDDGVRVWDRWRGVVDVASLRIVRIELVSTPPLEDAPLRLHGTVRARQGDFTGPLCWNRTECLGSDQLDARGDDGQLGMRFDAIRSIERRRPDGSLVTLLDGREIVLSGVGERGRDHQGIHVDDGRYGRVLISSDAFERVDFSPGGSGPAYNDFPPGRPLSGRVTTRDGRHLAGRLVYDLEESESIETFDVSAGGVDYSLLFASIASIVVPERDEPGAPRVNVALHDGELLTLDRTGDLGDGNAGVLVFVDDGEAPSYVPWADVERIDFDRLPADPL